MSRLLRAGDRTLKRLRDDAPLSPGALQSLTRQLCQQGVATPACQLNGDERLEYAWVEGESARERYAAALLAGAADWPPASQLRRWLQPLLALHRAQLDAPPPSLALGRRIEPRLMQRPDPALLQLWQRLQRHWHAASYRAVPVHGDFHLGQLILPPAPDAPCQLIDLEDCAMGAAAFDLGNFSAHLASAARRFDPVRYQALLTRVHSAYGELGGSAGDAALLPLAGRISLLRRYLKLRQREPGRDLDALRRYLLAV